MNDGCSGVPDDSRYMIDMIATSGWTLVMVTPFTQFASVYGPNVPGVAWGRNPVVSSGYRLESSCGPTVGNGLWTNYWDSLVFMR